VRPNIKFSDGTPLNAQVVADNLNAYKGNFPGHTVLLFFFVFKNVKAITVTGPMTVKVDMVQPWSAFPAHLFEYGRLGIMAESQLHSGKNCYKDMVGTGPFKLQSWVPNNQLVVEKNPNYWRKDSFGQQLPYLDKLTFKPVPDPSAMLNGLQSGAFDLANTDDTTTVIPGLLPSVKSKSMDLAVAEGNPETAYTIFNVQKAPFNNILARQAWVYAYDFTLYNKLRLHDLNKAASGPFGPGVMGYLPDAGLPQFNLDTAKQKVTQYKQQTGQDLNFTLSIPNDAASQASAAVVQGMMAKAGMKVSLKPEEQSQQINDVIAGSYQAAAWRNHPGFDPDTQYVWWACTAPPGPAAAPAPAAPNLGVASSEGKVGNNCDNPVNFTRYNDPQISKDLNTGRTSTDPAVRKQAYEDLNREFAKQLWSAWAYWSVWTVPYKPNVRGILGPTLPTADSPDVTASGAKPYNGLSSGTDVSTLWSTSS
jgi:peptide/nickel transport system substrate-binding protein